MSEYPPAQMAAEAAAVLPALSETGSSLPGAGNCPAGSLDLSAESIGDGEEVVSSGRVKRKADLGGDLARYGLKGSGVTAKEPFEKLDTGGCDESSSSICGNAQDLSPDTILRMIYSSETTWTDEKHSSYLNTLEEEFVRKMYGGEYCDLDLSGQAPRHEDSSEQDCVESRPVSGSWAFSYLKEFKAWQWGGQHSVTFTRPLQIQIPTSAQLAVLANPWVKHFRSTSADRADVGINHWQVNLHGSNTIGHDKPQRNKQWLQRMAVESHTEAAPVVEQDRMQSHLNSCNKSPQESKEGITTGLKLKMQYPMIGCQAGDQLLFKHRNAQNCQFHNQGRDAQSTYWNSTCIPEVYLKSRKRHRQVGLKEMPFKISKMRMECNFSTEYSDEAVANVYNSGAEEEAVPGMLALQDHSTVLGNGSHKESCTGGCSESQKTIDQKT